MIGHLGPRVSALVDGQLSEEETERAWAHVHVCRQCRDAVEREGWVKRQLCGLSSSATPTPTAFAPTFRLTDSPDETSRSARRRMVGATLIGGGAAGAAMVGVLALAAPASAPSIDRNPPTTQMRPFTPDQAPTPVRYVRP